MSIESVRENESRTQKPTMRPLERSLEKLRAGYERERNPSLRVRLEWLKQLEQLVLDRREDIASAVHEDFDGRSKHQTIVADVFMTVESIRYARSHLSSWLGSERRRTGLAFLPGRSAIQYQPKGVVGIISPWNYPVNLALAPMAGALAAGNRVMLKPSELTPRTSQLLASMFADAFADDLISVVTGDAEVGAEFAGLPFDHLLFTGSTRVGKLVMRAAAEHLTPVTLELGGKSPAIIHGSYPLEEAAKSLVLGKWFNAGQTCIAPDYVLVSEDRVDALVRALESEIRVQYPRLLDNRDYTAVVSDRHLRRLRALIKDASTDGARIIEINPAGEELSNSRKLAPTLVLDASDDMAVMQEEIFGPVLPIVTFRTLYDAIRYVNDHPRPLALYYFDHDAERQQRVLDETVSGGVSINSCLLHFGQDDLPFGGVGGSGMGSYHGREGFETFSHKKGVFYQTRINAQSLLAPPYGKTLETLLRVLLRV